MKLAKRVLRRAAASLFVLILPKAALAAETKSKATFPVLALAPIAPPVLIDRPASSMLPRELRWLESLSFGPRKPAPGRVLPVPEYEDRRKNCGKYCVPTLEMDRASALTRSIFFGIGAAGVGTGFALALAPSSKEKRPHAPSFRFCIGTQKLTLAAAWSF